jgi:hypothetical protein
MESASNTRRPLASSVVNASIHYLITPDTTEKEKNMVGHRYFVPVSAPSRQLNTGKTSFTFTVTSFGINLSSQTKFQIVMNYW